jgi:hypothetical protein
MIDEVPPQKRERNERTYRAHQHDMFRQITIPLIVILVVIFSLLGLTVYAAASGGSVAKAGDVALIFLIIPLMLIALISGIVFGAVAYGLVRLNNTLPFYTKQVQDAVYLLQQRINSGSNKVTAPILKVHGFIASVKAIRIKNR